MGIFDSLGGLWDWLTTQNPGGSAGGTPYLGAGSPTASTQSPIIGPLQGSPIQQGSPMLGGTSASGGGWQGLLGGQQPLLASYFQPQGGGLLGFGNTPLGGMIRGGIEGLGSAQGVGGLRALGVGAMGAGQAEQQRRQDQMKTILAGQEYQKGQYDLVSANINNQFTLMRVNAVRKAHGLPELAMNDLVANPLLASNPLGGQAPAQPITSQPQTATATPAAPSPQMQPITAPSATNPNVAAAYGGLGSGGVTDPSRGSSWGAPPGVADPTLTVPAPYQPPAPVSPSAAAPSVSPADYRPDQQQPAPASTAQQPAQTATTAGQPDIYAGEQAYVDQLGENAYTPEQLDAYYKAAAALEDKRAQTNQAVQTAQATAAANFASAPDTYKRITDLRDKYTADKDYQAYHEVLPYYQSGMAAFRARDNTPGGPATSDFDLVNAVIHMANPNAGTYRPGTAISATDIATIPEQLQASVQKLFGEGTALDPKVAARLADSLQRNMAPREAAYNRLVSTYRAAVQYATPQGMSVPEVVWRPDMPPPPPPTATGPNDPSGKPTKLVLQNGTYDYATGKWVMPDNPQWLPQ